MAIDLKCIEMVIWCLCCVFPAQFCNHTFSPPDSNTGTFTWVPISANSIVNEMWFSVQHTLLRSDRVWRRQRKECFLSVIWPRNLKENSRFLHYVNFDGRGNTTESQFKSWYVNYTQIQPPAPRRPSEISVYHRADLDNWMFCKRDTITYFPSPKPLCTFWKPGTAVGL